MATVQELATRALRRIRIITPDETPSAADITAASNALNEMIASWEAYGLSGDILPLDPRFDAGIVAMLALRLSDDYGKEPTQLLVRDADEGWSTLRGAYFAVPLSDFDVALTETGQEYPSTDTVLGNDPLPYGVWQASTTYYIRQFVEWSGHIYECTTGGVSGSTGPTGTDTEITDGTVTWCWRRASGVVTTEG